MLCLRSLFAVSSGFFIINSTNILWTISSMEKFRPTTELQGNRRGFCFENLKRDKYWLLLLRISYAVFALRLVNVSYVRYILIMMASSVLGQSLKPLGENDVQSLIHFIVTALLGPESSCYGEQGNSCSLLPILPYTAGL